jgi:hypothetical protein
MPRTRRLVSAALAVAVLAGAFTAVAVTDQERPADAAPVGLPAVGGGAVLAMVRHGSTLYLGGRFATVGGLKRNGLAAIDLTTGAVTPWAPRVGPVGKEYDPVEVRALAVSPSGSTVYIGGMFDFITGTPRNNLAAVSSSGGGALTGWAPALVDPPTGGVVNALALDASGETLYLAGAFTAVNGAPRSGLAAVGTAGGVKPFGPALTGSPAPVVNALVIDESNATVYVGGHFASVAGEDRSNLAAVDAAGTGTATSWDPGAGGDVASLVLNTAQETVYVAGSFTTLGGEVRKGAGAITTAGDVTIWYSIGAGFNPRLGMVALGLDNYTMLVAREPGHGGLIVTDIDGVGATIDVGPVGVHAAVFAPDGTIYLGGESGVSVFPRFFPPVLPALSIGNASVVEGDQGERLVRVVVTRSGYRPYASSAHYEVTTGTATPGDDFVFQSGTVAVGSSRTIEELTFRVAGDVMDEPNEFFRVRLSAPERAVVGRGTGVVTITDDDVAGGRRLSVGNAAVVEGDDSIHTIWFAISLSKPHTVPVTFSYTAAGGSASAGVEGQPGADFRIRSGTETIAAGKTTKLVRLLVYSDRVAEADEQFTVRITNVSGASISRPTGTGTIIDDD